MEQNKKKQVAKISVFITSIFVIFLSVTYAFINMTLTGTKRQVITSGNLQVELEEDNAITLTNAMPMYDEVGMIQEAFNFQLVNKTSENTNYIVKLVDITDASKNKLDTSIIKYGLTKDGESTIKYLSNIVNGQIDKGVINGNHTIEYSLRLWIDSKAENNLSIQDKSLSYRIDIEASQEIVIGKPGGTLKAFEYSEETYGPICAEEFCVYRNMIESIIFENKIDIPASIAEDKRWDLSEEQNGSVMAYIEELESDPDFYKLHFQGENGVYANPDCTAMFAGLGAKSIVGLEYFDTSKVTNMFAMFINSGFVNLDLSHFDTSNVTNMLSMFYGCSSLRSLDLNNFDTSKVTDMSNMFYRCDSLTSLDLSYFNTSNVTDMSSMFVDCINLTSLDLSNFDTSKVTDMSDMFYGCSGLTNLNLSHFNTSNVTDMFRMFDSVQSNCLITVKNEATKAWVLEQNSELTNVVVKSA